MMRTVLRSAAAALAGAMLLAAADQTAGHAAAPKPVRTPAAGIPGAGSIVYVRKNDLWLTTADGSRTQRVTWDGGKATTNHTGGVGYLAPSQSDSGLIVAVRNQKGAAGYPTGWLWVMNRQGAVLHRFAPLQHSIASGRVNCSPVPYMYQADGISNAIVSPDGTKIAYVEQGVWQSSDCTLSHITSSFVVNINGSGARQVRQPAADGNNPWDIQAGSWATSSRLVLARTLPGDEELLYADAPTFTTHAWWVNPDSSDYDDANQAPSLRHGVLATVGVSSGLAGRVLRLWTASGSPGAATPRCEYAATGGGSNPVADHPSVSPDGTGVTWFEQGDGATEVAGEGIYVMRTGNLSTACPADGSKVLLVQGGYQPFWGKAGVTTPPAPTLRINSVRTREGASGRHNLVFTVTRTGNAAPAVSVAARTASRTATSGVDFVAVSVRVRFAAGVRTRTVSVPVKGDRRYERTETFTVRLSSARGARVAVAAGTGTILNDDKR